MAMQKKAGSLGYFNLARGVGVLTVLLGHSGNLIRSLGRSDTSLFSGAALVLGGGMMAMFFMISGFGFYQKEPRKCLSIQAKMLLKPYCMVALLILISRVLFALAEGRSPWKIVQTMLPTYLLGLNAAGGGVFLGMQVESVSIFWYILALFGGWIIYNSISRLKNEKLQWGLVAACTLSGYLLSFVSKVWPFCFPMMLLAVGYLFAGVQIRQRELLERPLPLWAWGALVLPVLASLAWGYVDIGMCAWGLGPIDVYSTFCLGFLFLRGFAWVANQNFQSYLIQKVECLGFNSLWIICIHALEKAVIPWGRLRKVFPGMPAMIVLTCFAGRCVIIYLLYQVMVRWNKWSRRKKRGGKPKVILDE